MLQIFGCTGRASLSTVWNGICTAPRDRLCANSIPLSTAQTAHRILLFPQLHHASQSLAFDMDRVQSWHIEGKLVLFRACLATSEDSITGADQKQKIVLFEMMHRRFSEKEPAADVVVERRYGFHRVESCRKHFTYLSANAQKLGASLRKVPACNPTGVNEESGARWWEG